MNRCIIIENNNSPAQLQKKPTGCRDIKMKCSKKQLNRKGVQLLQIQKPNYQGISILRIVTLFSMLPSPNLSQNFTTTS